MPGIWASEYALPLLSFNGAGGILYGGLWIFVSTMATATETVDFNGVNLVNALVNDDGDDDDEDGVDDDNDNDTDGDGDFDCDWLSNGLPVFTGAAIDSLPADKKIDKKTYCLTFNSLSPREYQISIDEW